MQATFPKQRRLLTKQHFQAVFEKSSRYHLTYVSLFCRPSEGVSRLGFALSKKNVRSAAQRNLIKRIIRESFRLQTVCLKGIDIVVIARTKLNKIDRAKLRSEVDRQWSKLLTISLKTA